MKYPVLITYIRTLDRGQELRYSLRSLKNITNWNGDVFVVGDREAWFKNIHHIHRTRIIGKPYLDQVTKLNHAVKQIDSDKIIISMDDVYILEPTKISFYTRGELVGGTENHYRRTKLYTAEKLRQQAKNALDYECHAPYLVDKDKFIQITDMILNDEQPKMLQWRSLYGNTYNPPSQEFEDKKTKSTNLMAGAVISTQFYTRELDMLFPEPSIYEV